MTDEELIREYKRRKGGKMLFLAERVLREGDSLARIFGVLEKSGLRPHIALYKAFGVSRPENVTEKQLRDYSRKRETEIKPERLVDGSCRGCAYMGRDPLKSCEYILIEKKRRGCPAGKGCTKRKAVRT